MGENKASLTSIPHDQRPLSKHDESFVREYFDKEKKPINKIIYTPFEGLCLVQFHDNKEKIFDIDGFHPEEVPYEKWDGKMKEWYDSYTRRNYE